MDSFNTGLFNISLSSSDTLFTTTLKKFGSPDLTMSPLSETILLYRVELFPVEETPSLSVNTNKPTSSLFGFNILLEFCGIE